MEGKEKGLLGKIFYGSLLLKLLAGLFIGAVYHFFYQSGDTLALSADSRYLSELARQEPGNYLHFMLLSDWERDQHIFRHLHNTNPRAVIFSKYLSLANLLTFSNYWLNSLLFSLLAFAGTWQLFRTLHRLFPGKTLSLAAAFLLFPSVLVWTSGVMKESLLAGALGFIIAFCLRLAFPAQTGRGKPGFLKMMMEGLLLLLCLYLVARMKYYYLGALLPAVVALLSGTFARKKGLGGAKVYWLQAGAFAGCLLLATTLHPNLYPRNFLQALVRNHQLMAEQTTDPASLIHLPGLAAEPVSLLRHLPTVLWEGTFRPWLWESGHWLKKLAGAERFGLLLLVVLFAFAGKKKPVSKAGRLLLLPALCYTFTLLLLLGYAAPNLGNLSRYQACFLSVPVFMLISGVIFRKRQRRSEERQLFQKT